MAAPATTAPGNNLGFLTILQEPAGTLGGYLVTNPWGRPVEFRLSTAVQPNRVHQILYGKTLRAYVCAELIGKALEAKLLLTVPPDQMEVCQQQREAQQMQPSIHRSISPIVSELLSED